MNFIKDCLSSKTSLRDVATKYNMSVEDVFLKYREERCNYTDEQIEQIMQEVYYEN